MSSPPSKTIILVSGGNQGIGLEIVKKLSVDPTNHIFLGTRTLTNGESVIYSLPKSGAVVEPIQLDVTSDASIAAAVTHISSGHGRLDVLINNAGIGNSAFPPDASNRELFDSILTVNVTGAACLTDAWLPLLSSSARPRLIFVSSAVGSLTQTLDPASRHYGLKAPAYKTSKAAMNMLTATYAVMFRGEEKWSVNSCTPGLSATAFTRGTGKDPVIGAEIACRLARGEVQGTGGFWDFDGTSIPW